MPKKKKEGFEAVGEVCELILNLTVEDFEDSENICKQQMNYSHPLKNATVRDVRDRGKNNMEIVNKLKDLQNTIKLGEHL